jgi:hypothetical protein
MEGEDGLERRWRWWVLLFWLGACAWLLYMRWAQINAFALGDTDDNMRIMQVRGLLAGQGWYDLRQYRLNPPWGADIHWSRLVDLPIAGSSLRWRRWSAASPRRRPRWRSRRCCRWAVAMAAVAATARRLIAPGPSRWPSPSCSAAIRRAACGRRSGSTIMAGSWPCSPWRWPALTDPKRARGGALLGDRQRAVAGDRARDAALSRACRRDRRAALGARPRRERRRLATYGASVAGGTALGFLVFASYANRAPVCDALSPVWLSAVRPAGRSPSGSSC